MIDVTCRRKLVKPSKPWIENTQPLKTRAHSYSQNCTSQPLFPAVTVKQKHFHGVSQINGCRPVEPVQASSFLRGLARCWLCMRTSMHASTTWHAVSLVASKTLPVVPTTAYSRMDSRMHSADLLPIRISVPVTHVANAVSVPCHHTGAQEAAQGNGVGLCPHSPPFLLMCAPTLCIFACVYMTPVNMMSVDIHNTSRCVRVHPHSHAL